MSVIDYFPPPIAKEFIKRYLPGELFYDWIVGPFGSAKTTAMFFKLAYLAGLQEPSPDGIRYTRAVVVRNTFPQLRDSTLTSWNYWFQDGVHGDWNATAKNFTLRTGDVCCEVMFRPLDTPADVQRVLGLEVTFALFDEFREIQRPVFEGLSGRVGRFKPPGGVAVTNWGVWGASNPGTEDLWWYDYLHSYVNGDTGHRQGCVPVVFPFDPEKQAELQRTLGFAAADAVDEDGNHLVNAWYYKQPSGLAPNAENIEHLPGRRAYYKNLAKDKSPDWIKQYIEAEWGFSAAGQPVVRSFRSETHIAKEELRYNPGLRLIVGLDPGLGGSGLIFMQQGLDGVLYILGELVQSGYGAKRLIAERLEPYLASRFPGARLMICPDPSAANRNANDEKRIVETFQAHFGRQQVCIETNNRLPLRLDAIDHFCNSLAEGKPALQVDPVHCPVLIRALKGGWRWGIDVKKDEVKDAEPEKNPWSHPGDAFGYGCRYYHKSILREERQGSHRFTPPRYSGNDYAMR